MTRHEAEMLASALVNYFEEDPPDQGWHHNLRFSPTPSRSPGASPGAGDELRQLLV